MMTVTSERVQVDLRQFLYIWMVIEPRAWLAAELGTALLIALWWSAFCWLPLFGPGKMTCVSLQLHADVLYSLI
jgi:hypothetical protein